MFSYEIYHVQQIGLLLCRDKYGVQPNN